MRFELDAGAERATANLRLFGAVVVSGCAIWMAASDPSALGWFFVIFAALFALGWTAAGMRGRRRARQTEGHFLEVRDDGLLLADGARRLQVPWNEVDTVDVDEDRLVIEVRRRTGDPIVVQPRYRGIGLHELGRVLADAHRDARAPQGG